MKNKLYRTKETIIPDEFKIGFKKLTALNYSIQNQNINEIRMGNGSCSLCDCPQFKASTGGKTCINYNSDGGTCNHYEREHN